MDSLPFDTNHPAVKNYLALIRLQVLTPLSLLINIATVAICTFITTPTIGDVVREYPTTISPKPIFIAVYVLVIYASQLGYCILLVTAHKPETKKAMIQAVGLPLVFANWAMAFWAIAWVMRWFLAATVLIGIQMALLLFSNIALLIYHKPTRSRPLDTALIHTPVRFFLILPMTLIFPTSLFITLGLTFNPNHPERAAHAWAGFGVMFGVNLLGFIVILLRRDVTWAVAATWLCVSVWAAGPKPMSIFVTVVMFTALHPVALIGSYIFYWIRDKKRQGQIRLDGEGEEEHLHRGPREVDWDE